MHRLDVHRDAIAVAAHRVDEVVVRAALFQQLRCLDAVLVGVLLKVDVVEQTHVAPEIHVLAVAQLLGVPTHDPFHRQRVLEMEMILIVLAQQLPRCLSIHGLFHVWFLLFISLTDP